MAPKAANKRVAPEAKKAAPPKKTKPTASEPAIAKVPADPVMAAIEATIELADLAPTCKNMLVTGIRRCLNTPSEEMHEVQRLIVSMVDEVISAREALLQEALASAKATEESVGNAKADLAAKLSSAEAVLAEKLKIVDEKTQATQSAVEQVTASKAVLREKEEIQTAGDAVMVQLQADKAAVEKGIENDAKAITEGQANCQELLATLDRLKLDESLIKALPATCARVPGDRGEFDRMVLKQLETVLAGKLAELVKSIEAEEPGVKDRAAALSAANEEVVSATTLQTNSAEAQTSAEACKADASAVVDSAKSALNAHEPEEQQAAQAREEKAVALDDFQKKTKVPFIEFVRDRKSSVVIEDASPDAKVAPMEVERESPVAVGGA